MSPLTSEFYFFIFCNILFKTEVFKTIEKCTKALYYIFTQKGPIPSIRVEPAVEDGKTSTECDCDTSMVAIRLNDLTVKMADYDTSSYESGTVVLAEKPKSVYVVKVNEDFWHEIIVENCGQISVKFNWIKEDEHDNATKYDCGSTEQPVGCIYFNTRSGVLGPGQVRRLDVLFRPKVLGPYWETWVFQVVITGRLEPVIRIRVLLQGCALPDPNSKMPAMEVCIIMSLYIGLMFIYCS